MRTSRDILPDESAPSIAVVGTLAAWPLLPARAVRPTRWMYLPRTVTQQNSQAVLTAYNTGTSLELLVLRTAAPAMIRLTHKTKLPNLLQAQATARHESHIGIVHAASRDLRSAAAAYVETSVPTCSSSVRMPGTSQHMMHLCAGHTVTVSAPPDRDKCSKATASEEKRMPDCASCRQRRHIRAARHVVIQVRTEGLEALLCRNPCISLSGRSIARSQLLYKTSPAHSTTCCVSDITSSVDLVDAYSQLLPEEPSSTRLFRHGSGTSLLGFWLGHEGCQSGLFTCKLTAKANRSQPQPSAEFGIFCLRSPAH